MRDRVDLSHYVSQTGDIGRLQTLAVVPVVAGDGIELDLHGIFRLSPLRRQMVTDCHLDFFAFFVPHRHIYGDDWIDFIKGGLDEDVTFPHTKPLQSPLLDIFGCFSVNRGFSRLPAWIPGGYAQIWHRYFRSPTYFVQPDTTGGSRRLFDDEALKYRSFNFFSDFLNLYQSEISSSGFGHLAPGIPGGKPHFHSPPAPGTPDPPVFTADPYVAPFDPPSTPSDLPPLPDTSRATSDTPYNYLTDDLRKGMLCARLKRPWSTGVKTVPSPSDREVEVSGNRFDIVDLKDVRHSYGTKVDRDWFGLRYKDILGKTWGQSVNVDADQRPTLLMRRTEWMSGHDIDGHADANLGQFSGKSASMLRFGFPRKHFNEHGALWIMCLPRFPPLHYGEVNAVTGWTQPTYRDFALDPELFSAEPPVDLIHDDWFSDVQLDGQTSRGFIPYGQHWRTQPNFISERFQFLQGFPFITPPFRSTGEVGFASGQHLGAPNNVYYSAGEFDSIFHTAQLDQWQCQARLDIVAHRKLSSAKSSLYVGA